MENLLLSIKLVMKGNKPLPFSVYSSIHEQRLLNVPINKPLLIVVLNGDKHLGSGEPIVCPAGHFVFLSDSPAINMRNIPSGKSYFALLIEFDYPDFVGIPVGNLNQTDCLVATAHSALKNCLQQFVESTPWATKEILAARKKEILLLLYHLGHQQVASMIGKPKISYRLHDLFHQQGFNSLSVEAVCEELAMSESTLRRKLKLEGTSIQAVKDRARLGLGLHLLQTSHQSIGLIAEKCGYHSQSRFTDRFKSHFGLTPSDLSKTRLND